MCFRSTRGSHVAADKGIKSDLTHAPSLTQSPRSLVFSSNASLLILFRNFSSARPRLPFFSLPATPTAPVSVRTLHRSYQHTHHLPSSPAGMPHRKPLATLDPQSAHSRLTEDMTYSPSSSSRLPSDPKDAATNRYGRHIVSRGSIGDESILIHSASSSRKNSLAQ